MVSASIYVSRDVDIYYTFEYWQIYIVIMIHLVCEERLRLESS